jgi:hypothetical protein
LSSFSFDPKEFLPFLRGISFLECVTREAVLIFTAGKSYIGKKIVQSILGNTKPTSSQSAEAPNQRPTAEGDEDDSNLPQILPEIGPLLVVTFTNHALVNFYPAYLRLSFSPFIAHLDLLPPTMSTSRTNLCSSIHTQHFDLLLTDPGQV